MSAIDSDKCFRPGPGGIKGWLATQALAAAPAVMSGLRRVWPIAGRGKFWIVTRYDDVLEVFGNDTMFGVPYQENLNLITGGKPFFLGMADTPQYWAQLDALQAAMQPADLLHLGDEAETRAAAIVAASDGQMEVVGLVRRVAFDLLAGYFRVPEPARGRLDVWGSRLFEFQFMGSVADVAWVDEVKEVATAFHAHIDAVIAARRVGAGGPDDVLGRCLAAGMDATELRTVVLCMIVGGPPQPPMVVPQGIEQLLRRPDWLAAAGGAARANDDARLYDILFEAMRFDPLAPGLKRTVLANTTIAAGTGRATMVSAGATVVAGFASAMMDPRRVSEPTRFVPGRLPHEYVHFGHGLHECFGRYLNHATLHRIVKPLLAKTGLRRAEGKDGRLRKNGVFADQLVVRFD